MIDGLIYDVGEFAPTHPGGRIIEAYRGKGILIWFSMFVLFDFGLIWFDVFDSDATAAFTGAVYSHSRAARKREILFF